MRPANIDESYLAGETPREHAERLARGKAAAIGRSDAVTIGSDTIVVVDGDVLGKPRDRAHAAEMLRRLSGRSHIVITGVAVRWRGESRPAVEEVDVTFRSLSDDDIDRYIATARADGQGGRVRHSGIWRDDRRARRRRLLRRHGSSAQSPRAPARELGLRYAFGPLTPD